MTNNWLQLHMALEVMSESQPFEPIDESNRPIAILTTIIQKTNEGMK